MLGKFKTAQIDFGDATSKAETKAQKQRISSWEGKCKAEIDNKLFTDLNPTQKDEISKIISHLEEVKISEPVK